MESKVGKDNTRNLFRKGTEVIDIHDNNENKLTRILYSNPLLSSSKLCPSLPITSTYSHHYTININKNTVVICSPCDCNEVTKYVISNVTSVITKTFSVLTWPSC